jgi:hypothetical protein
MSDRRKEAMAEAVRVLRDAGCTVVSILATWRDGDSRSELVLPASTPGARGLGRGLKGLSGGPVRTAILGRRRNG